ncbi:MAG: SpoIIE family protein phosphatase, partial [Bacteroidales bacterium]|nr:SpoIIE family protein phosphatase [Bacteroidales bacterium]
MRNFSSRLTFYILAVTLIVFASVFITFYFYTQSTLENDVNVVIQDTSKAVAEEIQSEIYSSWYFLSGVMFFAALTGIIVICVFTRFVIRKISSPVILHQQQRDNELQVARNIQMSMVPKKFPPFILRKDVDVYGLLQPAKEVGGDFYDYVLIDDVLYFIIGDVSGKGVPAALFMAVTRSIFRACIDLPSGVSESAEKMLFSMNNMLCKMSTTGMFVTLFVGYLDLKTGHLSYCNAGHNPPVVCGGFAGGVDAVVDVAGIATSATVTSDFVTAGSDVSSGVRFLSATTNIPANIQENFIFKGGETTLQKGETLFLYTDGITEAENKKKNFFGEENLLQVLRKCLCGDAIRSNSYKTTGNNGKAVCEGTTGIRNNSYIPQQIINNVFSAVKNFAGNAEQNDDITMLAVTYYPPLQYTLEIEDKKEDLTPLYDFMQKWTADLDTSIAGKINLAVEEAVVNVISYAYSADGSSDRNINDGDSNS